MSPALAGGFFTTELPGKLYMSSTLLLGSGDKGHPRFVPDF